MLPDFLKESITKDYNAEELNTYTDSINLKRPLTIRINTLKTTVDYLLNYLKDNNIEYKTVNWSNTALIITNRVEDEIRELDIYKDGYIYLQSLSSQLPPLFVNPKENENILDMAAAPGGKTTELQALADNKAQITAVEKNQVRFERLEYNIRRLISSKKTLDS